MTTHRDVVRSTNARRALALVEAEPGLDGRTICERLGIQRPGRLFHNLEVAGLIVWRDKGWHPATDDSRA